MPLPIFLLQYRAEHGCDPEPATLTLPQRICVRGCVEKSIASGLWSAQQLAPLHRLAGDVPCTKK